MTTRIIVILTGLLLSTTGLSAAVVIPVNNPSFEDTTGISFMNWGPVVVQQHGGPRMDK